MGKLNADQTKLITNLLNTIAKLFLGGAFVGPFIQQIDLSLAGFLAAVVFGMAFHLVALYILGTQSAGETP